MCLPHADEALSWTPSPLRGGDVTESVDRRRRQRPKPTLPPEPSNLAEGSAGATTASETQTMITDGSVQTDRAELTCFTDIILQQLLVSHAGKQTVTGETVTRKTGFCIDGHRFSVSRTSPSSSS